MLQQSPDALLAAATMIHKLHSTVGPQPSTIKGGIPLQQRLFSRPSTAAPTTHTATDAKTSTASPENPLQRLLSNHPSKAISIHKHNPVLSGRTMQPLIRTLTHI